MIRFNLLEPNGRIYRHSGLAEIIATFHSTMIRLRVRTLPRYCPAYYRLIKAKTYEKEAEN